jgi:replicative DNA helicase
MGALRPKATGSSMSTACIVHRAVCLARSTSALKCWRLTFSDGTSIVADEQHRWLTTLAVAPVGGSSGRPAEDAADPEVVTTPQIADSVHVCREATVASEHNHSHPDVAGALQHGADVALPLDPYLLGCWLGDGSTYTARD